MEKRTPNDADDAGPLGQHHQHHWGPVSPFRPASRLPVPTGPGLMNFLNFGCWNRVLWWVCHGDIDGWDDGLQDLWWFYASFLRVLYWFSWVCVWVFAAPHPLPTQPSCEAKPMLMLPIDGNVQKTLCYCYVVCFLGLEIPVLSSLTDNGPR